MGLRTGQAEPLTISAIEFHALQEKCKVQEETIIELEDMLIAIVSHAVPVFSSQYTLAKSRCNHILLNRELARNKGNQDHVDT